MALKHLRNLFSTLIVPSLLLVLAACSSSTLPSTVKSTSPTPSPTVGTGQQLLATVAQKLNNAQTLHGLFHLNVNGPSATGIIDTEVWNAKPSQSRTLVQQSTLPRFAPTGSIIVDNGKQIWQYDPSQKVVYTGPVSASSNNTPNANGGQSQFLLNLLQIVLTRSDATLVSSSATVNGHAVDDIHVVSQSDASGNGTNNLTYDGKIYIDKTTQLPVETDLTLQGVGKVVLTIPQLNLNQPIDASMFTFVVPSGVKVLPLQQANAGGLTLSQAQEQAGYHLLSIPTSQTAYTLQSINALGAPDNQIYTLTYVNGTQTFMIAEGKPLANLPSTGQQISIRGTTGTLSTTNGATTLAWTEKGVGIRITGNNLSSTQIIMIANLLG